MSSSGFLIEIVLKNYWKRFIFVNDFFEITYRNWGHPRTGTFADKVEKVIIKETQ